MWEILLYAGLVAAITGGGFYAWRKYIGPLDD